MASPVVSSVVHVCQASTCRSNGSEGVLVEIEELAALVNNSESSSSPCSVKPSDCLGYCNQGPAALVVKTKKRQNNFFSSKNEVSNTIHVKIKSFDRSSSVVQSATGTKPPTEDLPQETLSRLANIRAERAIEYLISSYQWNKALREILNSQSVKLQQQFPAVLKKAGYDKEDCKPSEGIQPKHMPTKVENYVQWTLDDIEIVSSHSAIYKFSTDNLKRGTPHPRGRSRMAEPKTWHVTMLGEVGPNNEGPLPWIERDYTPVSSASEWEKGKCHILIKIYNDGQLTSWLHKLQQQADQHEQTENSAPKIWLSKPLKTLSVPSLVPTGDEFQPASILLLLAGTGVVALPQILAHREPYRLLGIATKRRAQLPCPIDVILSCREDDILMLPQIKEWCKEGKQSSSKYKGIRNFTLLVTNKVNSTNEEEPTPRRSKPPFHSSFNKSMDLEAITLYNSDKDENEGGDDVSNNITVIESQRLNTKIVTHALSKMIEPCRVIVSGPDSYNDAAREFLASSGVSSDQTTILSA